MKDILQKWLQERLGLLIEMEKLNNYIKDGTMLVKILKHYDAVNSLAIDIHPSDDKVTCKINLIQLKVWFQLLGVDFNNDIIEDILIGKISSCVNVLYQLYLCLENKNSLHFVPKQKERLIKKSNNKFKVTEFSLLDPKQRRTAFKNDYHCKYSNRLLKHDDVIKWYENKHCKKKSNVDKSSFLVPIDVKASKLSSKDAKPEFKKRFRYEDDIYYVKNELDGYSNRLNMSSNRSCSAHFYSLTEESFIGISDRHSQHINSYKSVDRCKHGCNNRAHFLPPLQIKKKQNLTSFANDVIFKAENYLTKLKFGFQSFKNRRESKNFSDFIIDDIWDVILENEEDDLRKIIAHRFLKQSMYERKLSLKFFQIMNQNEVQKQSYAELEKHIKHKGQKLDDEQERYSLYGTGVKDERDKIQSYNDYILYYQDERKRTVELHRRLYAEKLKLQFQKHYALCLETILDIIDIVIKKSEFNSVYEMPVPDRLWSQWKCLFYHGLPVFNVDEVCFDMISDLGEFELNRQTVLNECNLDNYLDVQYEWNYLFEENLSNIFFNNFSKNSENQFIVGFIVHRLLETKYPCQPPPKPADIPKYSCRVILNGVNDENVIMKLRTLLTRAEILVVDVNIAVNFCLHCYKDETGDENDEKIFSKKDSKAEETFKSSLNRGISVSLPRSRIIEVHKVKSTQTSFSTISEGNEMFPFGEAAKLGKELFSMMLMGNELPTSLIVNIVIEYIKSNSHKIKGWVLVNFPSTLFQASVLEYAFTSKKFPYHLEDDTASIFDLDINPGKELKDIKDNYSNDIEVKITSSRIVPNPSEYDGEDVFKTYFSKFLTAIKGEVEPLNYCSVTPNGEEFDSLHSESTLLLKHPEREGVPAINEFYREQGISYDFIYEKFNLCTIKQLAHCIVTPSVEDNNKPSSIDLFGEDILDKLAKNDDSKPYDVSDTDRTEVTSPEIVKNIPISSANEYLGLSSSLNFDRHMFSVNSNEHKEDVDKRETLSKPCDKSLIYSSDPILESVAIALASFWECLETVYLNNLKDVFYLKRNTDNSLIPYIHYINKTIQLCLNQGDDRQSIVTEFLDLYNGTDQMLRSDEEIKIEFHLRVNDLKNQLIKLCEDKKKFVEEMRRTLIKQNWTFLQMAAIANCFITMFQIEMDRCIRTLDLLKDYYYAMLELFKPEPLIYNDLTLSKIELGVEGENGVASEIIQRMLNYDDPVTTVNPVFNVVENKASDVCSEIEKIKSFLDNLIGVEESNALKIQKDIFNKKYKELTESQKRTKMSKGKVKSKSKDDQLPEQLLEVVENLKDLTIKKEASLKNMFLEWSCAVKGEVDRTMFCVEMIKKKAFIDLHQVESYMLSTFRDFQDAISLKFDTECYCIEKLCLLFQLAVEEKTPLHADIIFNEGKLHVSKTVIEKIETVIKLPPALEEMLFEESFTIKQLEEIKVRLTYVAPNGIIGHKAFVSLIQSMIMEGANLGSVKLVPKIWNKLNKDDFNVFFQKVFGNSSLIEWREFLIYCLDLPYPVTEDVVDAKLQFLQYDPQETETVSYENYMRITLWFHRELPESPLHALHNILAKEFLFSLYKVEDDNLINYTLLLMAFCKDEDVKVGFGKGLSLLYGKAIIMFEEDLYLEKILTDNVSTGFKVVNHILVEIIEDVVETVFGVMMKDISDLRYIELMEQDLDSTSGSTINVNPCGGPLLMESMYNQFFRRHLALQWTSKVPYVVIVTLLSVAFYPVFTPYYAFNSYSHSFEVMRAHITTLQEMEECFVYIPEFFNISWLEEILRTLHKFKALSLTNIIKEIISTRESSIK